MRVLVFEFITGGGFSGQDLPISLLQEGLLMRNALLQDLAKINTISVCLLHDQRVDLPNQVVNLWLNDFALGLEDYLSARTQDYDAVWLIAPETDGLLWHWTQFFEKQGKLLYGASADAVALCSDKLQTLQLLEHAGIMCVPTQLFKLPLPSWGEWVLKVNHSAGCDQVYWLTDSLPVLNWDNDYIIQPYIKGQVLSLSALFFKGNAQFICCNKQVIKREGQQFRLLACEVNAKQDEQGLYQLLCDQIAKAIPELFAYVGIDLILVGSGELLVLEINSRLTTSYAGINTALGLNIAALVMQLADQKPIKISPIHNQPVLVEII